MPPTVYLETTIMSYLTARLSSDLIVAAHQRATHDWWLRHRERFQIVASAVVLQAAALGDQDLARRRLALLEGVPLLEVSEAALELADDLVRVGLVPARVFNDALHIATSAVGKADYLMTWNLRHLAGAEPRRRIERELRERGFEPPMLCTPEELGGTDG